MTSQFPKMSTVDFEAQLQEILSSPWVEGINTTDIKSYLQTLPLKRFASFAFRQPRSRPLLQPRGGVPTVERQRDLLHKLECAGADFLPLTIDSNTRLNDYETAGILLEKSEVEDRDLLNGYPLVNHGYLATRFLFSETNVPISLRHGTPDARILVMLALASGITEIEGGALTYLIPYSGSYPVSDAVRNWQFVDRLCALVSDKDRIIHRESFGPLTATLVPPAITIAVQILELLLAAEAGIQSFSVSFGQTGSIEQDVACSQVLRKLSKAYLERFEYEQVRHYLVYHQWMGAFPKERSKAFGLIASSGLVASAIGANKIVLKTADEAYGIPSAESNVESIELLSYLFETNALPSGFSSERIDEECWLIENAAISIIDAVIGLGSADLATNVAGAFEAGLLDIPFSPHKGNANKLVSLKDRSGNIRIQNPGNVPIPGDVLKVEQEKLSSRNDHNAPIARKLLKDIFAMRG